MKTHNTHNTAIATIARRSTASLMVALALSACAAPQFRQPDIAVPQAFKEASAPLTAPDGTRWMPAHAAEAQPRGQWWLAFNDAALTALIEEASANNANLAEAEIGRAH